MKGVSIVMLTLVITVLVGKTMTKPGCKVNMFSLFLANFLDIKGEHVFTARMEKWKNTMERPKQKEDCKTFLFRFTTNINLRN